MQGSSLALAQSGLTRCTSTLLEQCRGTSLQYMFRSHGSPSGQRFVCLITPQEERQWSLELANLETLVSMPGGATLGSEASRKGSAALASAGPVEDSHAIPTFDTEALHDPIIDSHTTGEVSPAPTATAHLEEGARLPARPETGSTTISCRSAGHPGAVNDVVNELQEAHDAALRKLTMQVFTPLQCLCNAHLFVPYPKGYARALRYSSASPQKLAISNSICTYVLKLIVPVCACRVCFPQWRLLVMLVTTMEAGILLFP